MRETGWCLWKKGGEHDVRRRAGRGMGSGWRREGQGNKRMERRMGRVRKDG